MPLLEGLVCGNEVLLLGIQPCKWTQDGGGWTTVDGEQSSLPISMTSGCRRTTKRTQSRHAGTGGSEMAQPRAQCESCFLLKLMLELGLPLWLSGSRIRLQYRRPGFDPWVGKIPWRTERPPTPIFWPGDFNGLYRPWGHKESDMTE